MSFRTAPVVRLALSALTRYRRPRAIRDHATVVHRPAWSSHLRASAESRDLVERQIPDAKGHGVVGFASTCRLPKPNNLSDSCQIAHEFVDRLSSWSSSSTQAFTLSSKTVVTQLWQGDLGSSRRSARRKTRRKWQGNCAYPTEGVGLTRFDGHR